MARSRNRNDEKHSTNESIPPETRRLLWIIVLLTTSLVSGLAWFDFAGAVGRVWRLFLATFFGRMDVIVPWVLAAVAVSLLFPERVRILRAQWWGLGLLLAALTGLFHARVPPDEGLAVIGEERGGGYVGLIISFVLRQSVGTWGSLIILFGLALAGLTLLFRMTTTGVAKPFARARALIANARGRVKLFKARLFQEEQHDPEDALSMTVHELEDTEAPASVEILESASPPSVGEAFQRQSSELSAFKAPARVQPPLFPTTRRRQRTEVPLDLLSTKTGKPLSGDVEANKEVIEKTLANFGIEVEMGDVSVGPTVTQYTLRPAEGVKLSQITALAADLALALAAHPIRIEAPIPGKSLVGIEVPNQAVALVPLRECLTNEAFKKRTSQLCFAVGKDVAGTPWIADLAKMPHLLIAGATGSGKSVMINSLLISLLFQNGPEDLRLLLVDPKRVELSVYNDLPHLLTPVVTEVDRTINALRWVVGEMDRRFHLLSQTHKRNIEAYNANGPDEYLPYIVVVVDELADLMAVAAAEVEAAIIRLAQMARAVGIHLVVATQRPSVDIITGLIKANITARIAFAVASSVDSRTILDSAGAEKLLGRGDLLFTTAELSKPRRLQGAYVTDEEIERVANFWKARESPDYHEDITAPAQSGEGEVGLSGSDPRLAEARELVVHAGKASASFLQRRMSIGYARAARLLDLLEEEGTVGPGEGAKPREVLLSVEDLHTRVYPLPTESSEQSAESNDQGGQGEGRAT